MSGSDSFLIWFCFLFWFGSEFPLSLRRYWFDYWSLCWIRIILGAYINPLGWSFECVLRIQEQFRFSPLRVVRERDLIITLVFSSLFSVKISPLLSVDVGTLPNHVNLMFFCCVVILFQLLASGRSFTFPLLSLQLDVFSVIWSVIDHNKTCHCWSVELISLSANWLVKMEIAYNLNFLSAEIKKFPLMKLFY